MGFTENYLERRKKRSGGASSAPGSAAAKDRTADDFTMRYLALREARRTENTLKEGTPAGGESGTPPILPLILPNVPTAHALSSPTAHTSGSPTAHAFSSPEAPSTRTALERAVDAASGAMKTYGASLANAHATLYDLTQGARTGINQELLEAAQQKYNRALRDLKSAEALAASDPRYRSDLESARNVLDAARRELEAYGGAEEAQRGAAEQSYAAADQLAQSGQEDVERAKEGLSGLGKFAVDVGVGGAQLGADIAGGLATGGWTMFPLMLRSFGSGAQEARQEGADTRQAAAYGAASALTEILTEKISSLGNFNSKAFGSGALDDILEGAVGAVERMGKTEAGRKILNHAASAGIGFLSEGAEEFVSGVVSPLLKKSIYSKEPIDWRKTIQEAGYEFLVGGGIGILSGGIGGTNTADVQSQYLSGVTDRVQNEAYRTMAEKGMFSQEARATTRNALEQMGRAWERSGLPGLRLPTLEDLEGAQGSPRAQEMPGDRAMPQEAQAGPGSRNNGVYVPVTQAEEQKNTAQGAVNENGLVSLTEQEQANLSSGKKNKIVSTMSETVNFIRNALTNRQSTERAYMGRIPDSVAQRVYAETGMDIQGYNAVLPSEAVRHIFKRHGNEAAEGAHGQVAVTEKSAALIPVVLADPDRVYLSDKPDAFGRPTLMFEKAAGNYLITAQAVTEGRQALTTDTFYIRKKASPATADETRLSSSQTSETGSGPTLSDFSVQQGAPNVNGVNSVENAQNPGDTYSNLFTSRLERMGEGTDTAARLGRLLGRAAEGGALTAAEWSEVQESPNGKILLEAAEMLARRASEREGADHGAKASIRVSDGRADRGAGTDPGGQAGAVPGSAEQPGIPDLSAQRGGQAETAGTFENSIRKTNTPDRARESTAAPPMSPLAADLTLGRSETGPRRGRAELSGAQSRKAIARQDAVAASGARMVSTREYMGLDLGSERPCLFDAPEEVIRADRILSEVYDDIWEMGYRPHMFTGTPELEGDLFQFNGAVNGEDVFIRIDHSRYDADVIWDHEKFHILSGEDPGLVESTMNALLEKYSAAELDAKLEIYLKKYAGVYGVPSLQGMDWSDEALRIVAEELFADAYAGKDSFRTSAGEYRDTVREMASQRESQGYRSRGPPQGSRFSFGGRNARAADSEGLARAEAMERQGIAAEDIRQETGWFRGMDGQWRFEIDDSGMEYALRGDLGFRQRNGGYRRYRTLNEKAERFMLGLSEQSLTDEEWAELRNLQPAWQNAFRESGKIRGDARPAERLTDYIRHNELFRNYPQLREARLHFTEMEDGARGSYDPEGNVITVNEKFRSSPEDIIIHEVQHAIQREESFAEGSSAAYWHQKKRAEAAEYAKTLPAYQALTTTAEQEQFIDEYMHLAGLDRAALSAYRNTAGEIEARDASRRRSMTAEERRRVLPDLGDKNTVFREASRSAKAVNGGSTAANGISMSIETLPDGERITVIDQGQDAFAGQPVQRYPAIAKKILLDRFRGQTLPLGEYDLARLTARQAGEYAYPHVQYGADSLENKAKMRAAPELDHLLETAEYSHWAADTKNHPEAMLGFDYYTVRFAAGGHLFEGLINIANSENGRTLYDVTKIREIPDTQGKYADLLSRSTSSFGNLSDDSIPRPAQEVKPLWAGSARLGPGRPEAVERLQLQDTRDYSHTETKPAEIPGLRLPGAEYVEDGGRDTRFSADPTAARPADEEIPGLQLPVVKDERDKTRVISAKGGADREGIPPAAERQAAARKLTGELENIFPEMSRKNLRDLADEIRFGEQGTGASQDHLDALFDEAYDGTRVYDESPEAIELREIAHELRGRRVFLDQSVKEEFGDDWKATRQFFFGKGLYFTNDRTDVGLDVLNGELASRFGGRFDAGATDMGSVVARLEYVLRNGALKQMTLDEQARQYGGQEAAEKFREAYRQRFMDAAAGYRDTMKGISQAQARAREETRARMRRELEEYVTEARQLLRARAARGMDTGKTNVRTHIPAGMDIDQYVQGLEQRSARAREERLRTTPREEFQGSEAMEKLGIRITGAVTEDYQNARELRARQTAAEQARKAIRKAEQRLNATEAEKNFASGITAGVYAESDIPGTMDAGRVMELADYYMGERAFGLDMLRQRKADISRLQQEKAKAIFGPALEAGEGRQKLIGGIMGKLGDGFALNNRTAERNMRSIFGDEAGEKINQWLFAPVAENEGERYRFVNRMMDQVREIEDSNGKKKPLTKSESSLVQKVIEGRSVEEITASSTAGKSIRRAAENLNNGGTMQDIAQTFNLDGENRRLVRQYAEWLTTQKELENADTVKINNAVKLYSDLYGQFYEAINDFLTVHGYEPIGFIRGYAPHMQSKEVNGALQRTFQALGIGADISGLPTEIAGRTKDFKPNKRWNPYFQVRQGETTVYDVVGGFESYVDHLSDVLYHTDDITRIREANKFLRRMYAQEEISEGLSRAEELKYRTVKEKRDFLIDQGELDVRSALSAEDIDRKMEDYSDRLYASVKNTSQYGQLAVYLDDYANHLAGKQLFSDRDMERSFGRTSLNIGNKLTRAFTRAQVSGNLSSVLNQLSQLPIIQAELGSKYTLHALRDNWNGRLRRGDWALKSDFLTEKNGLDYITTSPSEMVIGALFKPLDFVDGFLSTLAVRGRYLKEIDAGRSEAEAMRTADRYGREVMGSRAKGSAPLAFQEKGIFSRMLHAFQLEALNTWEHLSQDLPRDFRVIEKAQGRRAAARALAGVAVKILLGNFLLNRASEILYGGTPAQGDVLGILGNFLASGAGTTLNAAAVSALKKLLNAGWEKVMGEALFDDGDEEEDRPFNWGKAAASAGSDMLNDAPLIKNFGALLGVGDLTLPMPDLVKGISRTMDAAKEDGPFSHEVMRQIMGLAGDILPGGRQAEKTFLGLDTALRGGRYSGYGENERLMYPVDEDPFTALRAALFGNSALEETGKYYASGEKALSVEQTKLYKELTAGGADKREIYNAILDWRKVRVDDALSSEEKARLGEEIVGETSLSDRKKLDFYLGLTGAESRAKKLKALLDAGLTWEGAIGAYAGYDEINRREGMTASRKATEFARWADENYPARQAAVVKEQFRYYSMVPAQAERYEKFTDAGLDTGAASHLTDLLSALEPELGKTQVSTTQKIQAVVSAGLGEQDQMAALGSLLGESEYAKLRAGYDQGVTPALYVEAKESISALDSNGTISQEEAKTAIKGMVGLTKEQKAALWQMQNKSWSAENNPFSRNVGREVSRALNQEEDKTIKGLTLPVP